ncbi:MAG: exodeoxyribonuclease III [Cyclobacteriaceae bacterium]|nr:MAG: exodeoxyribonuclease III [Cyclobacteriaceae bacterium]
MAVLNLVCWNVNGIRSIIKKDFLKDVKAMAPDMLCLQETKATVEDVKNVMELMPEYKSYVNASKARQGYSGTAILTKTEPISVTYDMAIEEHDQEGRVVTAEFDNFFLVTVYTPNAGEGLKRLEYRAKWDEVFRNFVTGLNRRKPVIICGDLNVAHQEIDIARAKENYNKSAGYTQIEIDGFQKLLDAGFVDTFRHFNPEEVKYTYWNYMFNARARNVGWRIDYFLTSTSLLENVKSTAIYNEYFGSDHCPIGLTVDL